MPDVWLPVWKPNVSCFDLQIIQAILLFLLSFSTFQKKDKLPRREFATRNYRAEVLLGFEKLLCRISGHPN